MAETGLNQNWNRDYDALTAKYAESDPIGLKAGVNTYAYVGADPIALRDTRGLWSTEAHNYILERAFEGLSPDLVAYLEEGSASVDAFSNQFSLENSFMHAMRAPNQSIADAKAKACHFIQDHLAIYNLYKNSSPKLAYQALGQALHPVMDSTSPVHQGWQIWNPYANPSQIFDHGDMPGSQEMLGNLLDVDGLLEETIRRVNAARSGAPCDCSL
jgi:hypothetical protein